MGAKIETVNLQTRLEIPYNPAVEASKFIEDPTFATGYFGPLGCGKTTAGVIKSWLYAQAWPGAVIAVIRDTYPNLTDTTMHTFFEWLPEGPAGTYVRSTRTFYLNTSNPKKPAEIKFRAMDQKDDVTNILSLDLAAAWIDEPQGGLNLTSSNVVKEPGIDHDLFLLLQSRLGRQSGYRPMVWLTGNPPAPSHWIAKDFGYSGYGAPSNPFDEYHLYLGTRDSNRSNLTPGYYERLERIFGKDTPLARRFLDGEWIEFAAVNPFHRSWIRYWGDSDNPLPDDLVVEIGFDPAISDKDTSAKSAIVVAGQCRNGINRGRIYILHANAGHWSVYEQVDQIINMARNYKARTVRIEDVAYQRALGQILHHQLRERGLHLAVELPKPDGDKLRRASGWSPWVESGKVLFHPSQHALVDCMISVPGDKNAWDLVDAAGICVRGFPALLGEFERTESDPTSSRAATYAKQQVIHPKMSLFPRKLGKIARAKGYAVGTKR